MKCPNCGAEFQGKFCPNCGNQAAEQPSKPKRKPIYKRWWFYFLATIVTLIVVLCVSCSISTKKAETIDWSTLRLANQLPDAPSSRGKVSQNTDEQLWISLYKMTDSKFRDYKNACITKGFSVEAEDQDFSYRAYNSEGYSLYLWWQQSSDKLDITLDAPMKLGPIEWPSSDLGWEIPEPDSLNGKFSYEQENKFFVYIGDTTREDYNDYVTLCADYGFTVDYSKGDNYYRASNEEGYKLSVEYVGFNIISIEASAPEKSESTDAPQTEPEESTEPTQPENDGELRADFKEAMDSYEEYMDEYVAFLEKYKANPTDLTLAGEYASMMSKYNDMAEAFDAWESEDLNAAETAYYIEVQTRVNQKLAGIA